VWVEHRGRAVSSMSMISWRLSLCGSRSSPPNWGWSERSMNGGDAGSSAVWSRTSGSAWPSGVPCSRSSRASPASTVSWATSTQSRWREDSSWRRGRFRRPTGKYAREATTEDLPALAAHYGLLGEELELLPVRSEGIWQYLLARTAGTEVECKTWVFEAREGVAGYMRCPQHHFGEEFVIAEAATGRADIALAMLQHAMQIARTRGLPGVRLSLHDGSVLCRVARALGASSPGCARGAVPPLGTWTPVATRTGELASRLPRAGGCGAAPGDHVRQAKNLPVSRVLGRLESTGCGLAPRTCPGPPLRGRGYVPASSGGTKGTSGLRSPAGRGNSPVTSLQTRS